MLKRAATLILAAAGCLAAADLTGHWIAQVPRPNGGGTRETVFILSQDGSKLNGKVVVSLRDTPIVEGSVNGDTFQFVTEMRFRDQTRRAEYKGRMENGQLHITVPGFGNNPPAGVIAKRGPDTAGVPPAPLPVPALHPVPYNGLAKTPPMGWNSWNFFAGRVDDKTVREMADAIVSSGMAKAGYVYINIDDTWEAGRDAQGNIQTNEKFPNMKALADYVHSKGLKLGIYSSPGPLTCAGYEGSFGHEEQDAKTYAAWGIDYLKYDWCSAGRIYKDTDMQGLYQKMGEALQKTGRPIVYSLCQYGRQDVWKWGPEVGGNLWRTTGDIRDSWDSMTKIGFDQDRLAGFAAPGHWNDPDMLEIGNGHMNNTEYRTHMSLWAMLAAPLLAGNDIRNMSKETADILMNTEVIAIDQDKLGRQGKRVRKDGDAEVWVKPLDGGAHAIALFNRGESSQKISVKFSEVGLTGKPKLRDLWEHISITAAGDEYSATVPAHGVVLLRAAK